VLILHLQYQHYKEILTWENKQVKVTGSTREIGIKEFLCIKPR